MDKVAPETGNDSKIPPNDQVPPAKSDAVTRAHELLRSYLEIYDGYNSDKETVVLAFVVFYLGGATALLGVDKPFWRESPPATLLALALVLFAMILALSFVLRLFRLRRQAGDVYHACTIVLTRWVLHPPTERDLQPRKWRDDPLAPLLNGFEWPKVLHDTLLSIRDSDRKWWTPRDVTWIAIVIWTCVVLWRIGSTPIGSR